jgi:UDP-N-acetylglucosamine 2-epimerase (non-hydrolysing)
LKILTVLGTRPEIIRLSLILPLLDEFSVHTLVHTGQNFDKSLSDVFFDELKIRSPDVHLGIETSSFGQQAGQIMAGVERIIDQTQPDRVLILGDTNSGLSAIVARRKGIPVYHMEAGNRCYDFRVPEESNRRIIDHMSAVLMPYTERSRANLVREGFDSAKIFVTGNPIKEVIDHHWPSVERSEILRKLKLSEKRFFLATLHRSENVDLKERLEGFLASFALLNREYGFPVVCSLHPRTAERARQFGLSLESDGIKMLTPFGFFDFLRLQKAAFCVLSDSGTVQEESCLLGVPNVTLRDVTERPETMECGSNVLAGSDPAWISRLVKIVTSISPAWVPPTEYQRGNVAATVTRILLSQS